MHAYVCVYGSVPNVWLCGEGRADPSTKWGQICTSTICIIVLHNLIENEAVKKMAVYCHYPLLCLALVTTTPHH